MYFSDFALCFTFGVFAWCLDAFVTFGSCCTPLCTQISAFVLLAVGRHMDPDCLSCLALYSVSLG